MEAALVPDGGKPGQQVLLRVEHGNQCKLTVALVIHALRGVGLPAHAGVQVGVYQPRHHKLARQVNHFLPLPGRTFGHRRYLDNSIPLNHDRHVL